MNKSLLDLLKKHAIDLIPGEKYYPVNKILTDVTPYRYFEPTSPLVCIEEPFCSFVIQGKKEVLADNTKQELDNTQFNLSVIDIPVTSKITEASTDKPYFGLVIRLDLDDITEFIQKNKLKAPLKNNSKKITLLNIVPQIEDILNRWISLLDMPESASILSSLYRQEFYFWLLKQPESSMLFYINQQDKYIPKIRKAIDWIRLHFNQAISIKELSARVSLSQSSFHQYFKQLTDLTPLQFQKQLRFQEARRLMICGLDANSACFEVGFESSSQFSREYKKCFGLPPKKDIELLKKTFI